MNKARVAALFRELAAEFDDVPVAPPAEESKPRQRAKPEVTDVDKARARKALRKLGVNL